jgi:hypothetical protein
LLRGVLVGLLALVLLGFATASSCGEQGGQYRQMGEQMGRMSREGTVPANLKYVVDIGTQQYWPNLPRYAEAIPSERRVYVKDEEALAQFKEYTPGPL